MAPKRNYALASGGRRRRTAVPDLPYRPAEPGRYRPAIGLIGCGGITRMHLAAYRKAGYRVAVLCDVVGAKARARQREFYPKADVVTDHRRVLDRGDVEVVDIATHPADRVRLVRDSIDAGKHVLSQKPFVTDLAAGRRLVALAARKGVRLAVNQNGRWAPHLSWMREAVRRRIIGELLSVHAGVHWDHTWTAGTPYERIYDLIFYDFAIHWFDFVASLLPRRRIRRVQASRSRALGQRGRPPMLAQAIIEFEGGQASLVFDAHIRAGGLDRTFVGGSKGSLVSTGPDLGHQSLTLHTGAGSAAVPLRGTWFPDGFRGTMAELLRAVEERREPLNGARENLRSLALCFAVIASASAGRAKIPGAVTRLPRGSAPGL